MIRNWLRAGYSVHDVVQITRQHPNTVEIYDPEATLSKRLEMNGVVLGKPLPAQAPTFALENEIVQADTFPCRYCPEERASKEETRKHEMEFHGEYRIQCGEKSTQFAAVKKVAAPQNVEIEVFKCQLCPEMKMSRQEMERHEIAVHSVVNEIQEKNNVNLVQTKPKKRLLSLDPFDDDAGIDFDAIETQSNTMIIKGGKIKEHIFFISCHEQKLNKHCP